MTPDRPLQCVDCGLVLQLDDAHTLRYGDKIVYPLCQAHYQRRLDTIAGNP